MCYLQYAYLSKLEVPLSIATDILHIAEYLNIPKLEDKCKTEVYTNLNSSNALAIYKYTQKSLMQQESDIEKMCLEHIMLWAYIFN